MPLHPANRGRDGIQPFELHPDRLVQPGPFDELDFAAFGRDIIDLDHVMVVTTTPQLNVGLELDAGALPLPRTPCSCTSSIVHAIEPLLAARDALQTEKVSRLYYTSARNGVKFVASS